MRRTRRRCDIENSSHDTKRSSKRLRGNAATGKVSLPGMTQWRDFPWEVQKRVLASRALSLHDLAKIAPVAKIFKEAYLERCTVEEQWLEDESRSVFGASAVNTLACWLPGQKSRRKSQRRNGGPIELQLAEGEPWPDLRSVPQDQDTCVFQPARFLPGAPVLALWWSLYHASRFGGGIEIWSMPMYTHWLTLICRGRLVECNLSPIMAAHVVPCLGLAYLVCKKAAEPLCTLRSPPVMERLGFFWHSHRLASWQGMSPDAQRALTFIHMRLATSWRNKISFSCVVLGREHLED
eukprot:jgi/Botrbrau1/5792/Bobra.0155s0015.1